MRTKIILFLIALSWTTCVNAELLIKERDMNLQTALEHIAKDIEIKLIDELPSNISRQLVTQSLVGEGRQILGKLAEVYDFDWYIYGGVLVVQNSEDYTNFVFRPQNISRETLVDELEFVFVTSAIKKIKLTKGGEAILVSGSKRFIRDVVSYAKMLDKNYFLDAKNDIEVVRIDFQYASVVDRTIESFGESILFPGAQVLITNAIQHVGQFRNLPDDEVVSETFRLKLAEGEKQRLDKQEQTTNVQVLPGTNSLLVRGTPAEVELAKRIAKLIDLKRGQLLFSLKVYDVAVEKKEHFGVDSSWLDGSRGLYSIVMPPFTSTKVFFDNFQALTRNGAIRGVYQTNLLVLENQRGHFGKKDTATITLISDKEVQTQTIDADNSIYLTGRLLPNGTVQARIQYVEESFDEDENETNTQSPPRVSSQSIESEVYIKPDETLILGGFEQTFTSSTTSGVPILSSVPILGYLFTNTQETKNKYKRYISISFEAI